MLRRMSYLLIAACVGIYAGACNPEDEQLNVNISGLSDQAAAEEIAENLCEHMRTCGQAVYECYAAEGQPEVCSGMLIYPEYNECYPEIYADMLEGLESVELTVVQEQAVNDCINGMMAMDCPTQADVDASVEALNRGEEPIDMDEYPAACEVMSQIFQGQPSSSSSSAQPGSR